MATNNLNLEAQEIIIEHYCVHFDSILFPSATEDKLIIAVADFKPHAWIFIRLPLVFLTKHVLVIVNYFPPSIDFLPLH